MMDKDKDKLKKALTDLRNVCCDVTAIQWFEEYGNTSDSLVEKALKTAQAYADLPEKIEGMRRKSDTGDLLERELGFNAALDVILNLLKKDPPV